MTRSTLCAALLLALTAPIRAGYAQTIQGIVREDPSGEPVAGAAVRLLDADEEALGEVQSDDEGLFSLRFPAPGAYRLSVSRMGYAQGRVDLVVADVDDVPFVEIYLRVDPVALDSLDVVGRSRRGLSRTVPHLERVGFYKRMEKGHAHFILREEIEEKSPIWVSDLFYNLPFARVVTSKSVAADYVVLIRGCRPLIVLDGTPLDSTVMNHLVHPYEIEAMEVYPGPGGVPVQYGGLRRGCGAILIWTRR